MADSKHISGTTLIQQQHCSILFALSHSPQTFPLPLSMVAATGSHAFPLHLDAAGGRPSVYSAPPPIFEKNKVL